MAAFSVKNLILVWPLALSCACSSRPTKIDPATDYHRGKLFKVSFPMEGEWSVMQNSAEHFQVGSKNDDGTMVAFVRTGSLQSTPLASGTAAAKLKAFETDIENEAKIARVRKIKSRYRNDKHRAADCLFYDQDGEDQTPKGPMPMVLSGMVCLHPKSSSDFVWMGISHRGPTPYPAEEWPVERDQFFGTLRFTDK